MPPLGWLAAEGRGYSRSMKRFAILLALVILVVASAFVAGWTWDDGSTSALVHTL